MPDAEIIAVGSELLTPQKTDTNSLYLTDQLNALGVEVVRKTIVGDQRELLRDTLKSALLRSQIVILTGGLGPTEDDVTREAVSAALNLKLRYNDTVGHWLVERFKRFGRQMAENNKRQAFVLEGAEVLQNDWGTAPGQWIKHHGAVIMLLPGPPRELKAIFPARCLPKLEAMLPPQIIRARFYRVAGMGESDLDQLIAPVYSKYTNPVTTILAAASDIQIHLRARCATEDEANALLEEVSSQIEPLLGDRLYARNGEPLEEVVGMLLRDRKATLAVAESITGGMIGERLTEISGSSDYFLGGFLTYSNEMKTRLVDVSAELIAEHTAVSEPVALAMAQGARIKTGADYGLSVTGYAGPDGAQVGLVFIGVVTPKTSEVFKYQFNADRHRIRTLATNTALDRLRKRIQAE
jgi:nicotinamide-nucleotide amidase